MQGHLKSLLKPILTKRLLEKQLLEKAAPKACKPNKDMSKIKPRIPMSNPPKPLTRKERENEIERLENLENYNKYLDSLLKQAISKM